MTIPERPPEWGSAPPPGVPPLRSGGDDPFHYFRDKIRQEVERHAEAQASYPFLGSFTGDRMRGIPPFPDACLCLAVTEACSGDPENSLGAAAALDIAFRALAVHEELIYGVATKAPSDTLPMPLTLNGGDGLMVLSLRPLVTPPRRLGPQLTLDLVDVLENTTREVVEGCIEEWRWWEALDDLGEDGYFRIVLQKVRSPFARGAVQAGLLIGGYGHLTDNAWQRFAFFWNAAWRLQQELHCFESAATRPLTRWSLPLALLLERLADLPKTRLRKALRLSAEARRTTEESSWIDEQLSHHGCLESARRTQQAMVAAALRELAACAAHLPNPHGVMRLAEMTRALAQP